MRRAFAAAAVLVLVAAASSCGGDDDSFRLAVQVDCQGSFSSFADFELAGAFLPLLQRGGRLAGPSFSSGVRDVRIAGRPIDVQVGCTETGEATYAVPQLRRLLEDGKADVVVGSGLLGQDGIVMRDIARRYPNVTFMVTLPSAQEVTLFDPASNLFRIGHDNSQSVGGLGTYAHDVLGWRTAAVVTGSAPDDWEQTAGFTAEFCSLGGAVTRDDGRAWSDPVAAAARYESTVDGVAVLSAFFTPREFLRSMASRPGGAAPKLVLGGSAYEDPSNYTVPGASLEGVVVATVTPRAGGPSAWKRYLSDFTKAYPGLPRGSAAGQLVVPYRNAVEAVAEALEQVDGDPGSDGQRLRGALARLEVAAVPSPMTLDENRQVVASVYLSKLGRPRGGVVTARTVRVVPGVEQTFGGIFGPQRGPITAMSDECDRTATPPPWAR